MDKAKRGLTMRSGLIEQGRDPRKKARRRGCERYAVQHNGIITTFGEKVISAIQWHEANPGSTLLSRYSGSLATHPWIPLNVIKISPEVLHAAD